MIEALSQWVDAMLPLLLKMAFAPCVLLYGFEMKFFGAYDLEFFSRFQSAVEFPHLPGSHWEKSLDYSGATLGPPLHPTYRGAALSSIPVVGEGRDGAHLHTRVVVQRKLVVFVFEWVPEYFDTVGWSCLELIAVLSTSPI